MKVEVRQDIPGRLRVHLACGRLDDRDCTWLAAQLRDAPGVRVVTFYRRIGDAAIAYDADGRHVDGRRASCRAAIGRTLAAFEPTYACRPVGSHRRVHIIENPAARFAVDAALKVACPLPVRAAGAVFDALYRHG